MASATLAAALVTLQAPSIARAQEDATIVMARERFREGVTYFDQKQYDKARAAFLQAYALKKHPAVLLNLAQSELRSAHEADAAKHFAQYLREHADATEDERKGAQSGLSAAKALVTEVEVTVDTEEAEVLVDGALEGRTPLPGPLYLAPGQHRIEARKDGRTAATEVRASPGLTTSAALRLSTKPKPAGAQPPPKSATPATEPRPAPEPPSTAPPPEPEVTTGRKPFFRWLFTSPVGLVGVGLTGVGAAGGTAFAFGAKASYDNADSIADKIAVTAVRVDGKPSSLGACKNPQGWLRDINYGFDPNNPDVAQAQANAAAAQQTRAAEYNSNCAKYTDNVDAGDTYKMLSTVSFIVAGAAAAGTIVAYFIDPNARERETSGSTQGLRLHAVPILVPGYAGASFGGAF